MRSFIQRMGDEGERLRLLRCSISVSRLNNYKLKIGSERHYFIIY